MYTERLLKDIGIWWEIVRGDYIIWHKFDVNLNWYFIKVYIEENDEWAIEYLFTSLSDILIKNIDKIINIYEKEWRWEKTMFYPENIMIKLIEAIQNNTEEDFAKSLYNNK